MKVASAVIESLLEKIESIDYRKHALCVSDFTLR
jgi:hypothetical protein